jgi:hypothetical protein
MRNKRIQITDIPPLKDSFKVPDGYFESLENELDLKKGAQEKYLRVDDIPVIKESFVVPEGYFDGLLSQVEERKLAEDQVVVFRKRRIKIWGSFVAAACVAMVVVSIVRFGPQPSPQQANSTPHLNIPDKDIAGLLDDRDDEFALTDEEIIEVIEHETRKDESIAIINFLENEGDLEGTSDEAGFLEDI